MRMPCVCRAHRLGRLCCISSRFDRALLAACRRPPTNALSTISSRRARCTEPRSATHRCAQGVAALIGVVAPSEALRSLLSHTWWRWAWACVNARGCAGRASEAGDAIGAQDDRALPRRWQARPLRPRACGGGAAPAGPTAIVVVGLGVWGWPICAIDAPGAVGADGAPERRVRPHGWRAALLRVRDPVSGALRSVQSAVRSPPRASVPCRPRASGRAHLSACAPHSAASPLLGIGGGASEGRAGGDGHRACPVRV